MHRRTFLKSTVAGAAVLVAGLPAHAEWTPQKPINTIVPYDAGGGTDTIARALAASVGDGLPVPLVIVNKPGASGIIGTTDVVKAAPDGSTILITSAGSLVLNSIVKKLDIDPFKDLVSLGQIGDLTTSVMVPASSPFKTIDDLVAAGKEKPGTLRWAHTGRGSFHHVAGQGFLDAAGVKAVDVPFKGGSATRAAVIGGQVDFGLIGIQQLAGFETELRPLALVSDKRDDFAKDVPTFKELGIDVPLVTSPIVAFAPAATPEDVVKSLQDAVAKAAASQGFAEVMKNGNNSPAYLNGEESTAKLMKLHEDAKKILASTAQ